MIGMGKRLWCSCRCWVCIVNVYVSLMRLCHECVCMYNTCKFVYITYIHITRIYDRYGQAVVVLVPLLGLYRQRFCVIDASMS